MFTVIVIDDSISMRRILKDIINSIEDFKVVYTARDAFEARQKIKEYEPDLVTIDIKMPKMDGCTFLRHLIRLHPMPAVVISGESVRGDDIFNDGAVGFIAKTGIDETINSFHKKVQDTLLNLTFLLQRYTLTKNKPLKSKNKEQILVENKIHPDEVYKSTPSNIAGKKIIAIGSSTGGVESLLKVFKNLPSNLPPIVITQHIPYGFSNSFANRLNDHSDVNVSEVKGDTFLENGCAYLAPGNMHLVIEKESGNYIGKLLDVKKVSRHKPSVNLLFRSVNNCAGAGAMAIIMTGMGDDGTICMKELYDNGAYTIAQNEESCVVFGMPNKAIEAKAIKKISHLNDISNLIIDFANNRY